MNTLLLGRHILGCGLKNVKDKEDLLLTLLFSSPGYYKKPVHHNYICTFVHVLVHSVNRMGKQSMLHQPGHGTAVCMAVCEEGYTGRAYSHYQLKR